MAAAMTAERRRELYGPERNVRFAEVRDKMTRSHVLQQGEYNYTTDKLRGDIWRTSNTTDFSGAAIDPSLNATTSSQLVHHFDHGNMSGKLLETDIFRRSTTQSDFRPNASKKPDVHSDSKEVNWPDMAPRYMKDRRVGPSEYTSSFITELRQRSAPNYPRVDTSKLQLPLNPEKFWRQRNTNFSLGSDNDGLISEQQRVYGRGEMAYSQDEAEKTAATSTNKALKENDKVSHVFRGGDYNDIVGNFVTTVTDDFGPRTVPPGEAALKKRLPFLIEDEDEKKKALEEEEEDECYANINKLQKYAREHTVPTVFKDASDGQTYQHNAHFHFGHDHEVGQTIHGKDFALSALAARCPPNVVAPPSAGKLLQFDPNLSRFGITSNSVDFQDSNYEPYKNSKGRTALEMNLDRREKDDVVFSFDLTRHTKDRQTSLNHSDFKGPPKGYKPVSLAPRHSVYVDYLQTDEALPYPPPPKDTSEAAHNFTGLLGRGSSPANWRSYRTRSTRGRLEDGRSTHVTVGYQPFDHNFTGLLGRGSSAANWRSYRTRSTRGRLEDGRSTHFTVGYQPFDFLSETRMQYRGDTKTDGETPFAGKNEKKPSSELPYIGHSENIRDLQAADPHVTTTREALPARMAHADPRPEPSNTTSVMKKDYGPMVTRDVNRDQLRIVDKYDKVTGIDIADSHLFHTDTSGQTGTSPFSGNNFVTTAMDDFIKPDTMTGRKFLAAR